MSLALPLDVRSLTEALAAGHRFDLFLFWGHTATPGVIDKRCFSQWYASPFQADGVLYRTAEHYMMAGKARLFGDDEMFDRIVAAETPGAAKKLGRKVAGFDDEIWKRERFGIVVEGNLAKFRAHPELQEFLLGTGASVLVEASPYDRIWGIGLSTNDPRANDPRQWKGQNLLGFALMAVRERLAE